MYSFVLGTFQYKPSTYGYTLSLCLYCQHTHIENIKTVANLTIHYAGRHAQPLIHDVAYNSNISWCVCIYLFVFSVFQYMTVCTGFILVHTGTIWVCTLIIVGWTGLCMKLLGLCKLGHQPSEAKQAWVCWYVLVQHWYIRVCTGTNNAFLNIWEQTFIWLWTTVGDTWSVGRVYGGTQAWL